MSTNCCNTICPYMVKNVSSQCVCALTAGPFRAVGAPLGSIAVSQRGEEEGRE